MELNDKIDQSEKKQNFFKENNFNPLNNYKIFKSIIVIAVGLITFAAFGAQPLQFTRTEFTSPLKIGKRHKAAEKTMIFSRIQPYDLYSNYLYRWLDRPLFIRREWRDAPDRLYLSFVEDIRLVKEYDIDGFTMLGNGYRNRYRNYLQIVEKLKPQNFKFMPGMSWMKYPYKRYLENARLGLESRYSPRINGKVPFFSYASMPLSKMKEMREKLAKDDCRDMLLFDDCWLGSHVNPAGRLPGLEKSIRKKLEVVDGLILANHNMHRDPSGDYTLSKKFNLEIDDKYFAPLLEKIYGEDKNKDKLLGFNIRHGYINHMAGTNEAERGTSQLRDAMDTALLFNPDIISLVEWNEANENTSFQPTVCNSRSMQRIIRFYARKLKGLATKPNPGDDLNIPNLIVSCRQVIKLGEKYRIELLNVPDSDGVEKYTVQLILKDQNGTVVKSFTPDSFTVGKLTAVTYNVPSEQLASCRAIVPELQIRNINGKEIKVENLEYTRLSPSVCWNFKEVRQPLRDLLVPVKNTFSVSAEDGKYRIKGSISADEPLYSVEVLNNEVEIFALDRLNEFKLDKNYLFTVGFSTKKTGLKNFSMVIPGVNDFIFKPWRYPYAGFGSFAKKGDRVEGKLLLFRHGAKILLAVPKNAENANVEFSVDGRGKFAFPVKAAAEKGKIAFELPGRTFVIIEKLNKLADHPTAVGAGNAELSFVFKPESTVQCFQLRAISKSSRIFRSKPIFPQNFTGKEEMINVFSASQRKAVNVKVPTEEITDIKYVFDPRYGALLRNSGDSYFDAKLGDGFGYLEPLRSGTLPKGTQKTAPEWVKSGNDWVLKFDGIGNYLVFPAETIPHGSFTLEFECRTDSKDNQVLFRHNSVKPGSLMTYIIDGRLQAEFYSMGRNYANKRNKLKVGLPFPTGQWVKVKVVYDLENIKFSVNNKTKVIPFKLRASKPTPSIFGGFSSAAGDIAGKKLKFFKGELRSFRIRHNAE
jgi:hypothetical protein